MTDQLRAYRDCHSSRVPDPGGALPPATARGIESFFTELHTPPDAIRVCRGTSCALAGADSLHEHLAKGGACAGVYCLGYCDRSPAVQLPDGRTLSGVRSDVSVDECNRLEPTLDPPDMRAACAEPIVLRRVLHGGHHELERAVASGVYEALRAAVAGGAGDVLSAVERSGERGRGGAAYPTGKKWRLCAQQPGARKFAIANGDEGDPGSFIDRVLMEMDPHAVLEGLALCGFAAGAREGIVYIRSEYPRARAIVDAAIRDATAAGLLGERVCGSDVSFHVRVVAGKGSYVCGEETAMLNAIEGLRGEVRLRPPYPVEQGLLGRPTVVDNVETLVNIPWILRHGAERYAALGTAASSGTKAFCLNHGFARPGIVEVEYGTPLRRVIEDFGGGSKPGTSIEAVILGGPMGSILFPDEWDVPVCYGAMASRGVRLGHAGLVALHKGVDWRRLLTHWLEFMVHESCGKCVPCRLGSQVALDRARSVSVGETDDLDRLLDVIESASLCGFGTSMPGPMRTILRRIKRDGGR